jgi:predicted DNA-binding protein with PD1-like motif
MDYRTGSVGRVLMIRLDHGDDLLENLQKIVLKEKIQSGWFQILGGIRHAGVVTGPEQPVMPPEPVWREVDEAREVVGSGSVFMDGDEPRIHLHAAMGHHGDTLTACIRKQTKVYLVLEVILFELSGIDVTRPWYEKGGFNRLTFS